MSSTPPCHSSSSMPMNRVCCRPNNYFDCFNSRSLILDYADAPHSSTHTSAQAVIEQIAPMAPGGDERGARTRGDSRRKMREEGRLFPMLILLLAVSALAATPSLHIQDYDEFDEPIVLDMPDPEVPPVSPLVALCQSNKAPTIKPHTHPHKQPTKWCGTGMLE